MNEQRQKYLASIKRYPERIVIAATTLTEEYKKAVADVVITIRLAIDVKDPEIEEMVLANLKDSVGKPVADMLYGVAKKLPEKEFNDG